MFPLCRITDFRASVDIWLIVLFRNLAKLFLQIICSFVKIKKKEMKKIILLSTVFALTLPVYAQFNFNKVIKSAKKETNKVITPNTNKGSSSLSNDEIISGLKEALTVGTQNSTTSASKTDGYFKNPSIKIPFPKEALTIKNTLENLGMKKQVDRFVLTLNRAAEDAAKNAAPVFINAIKAMTIQDGVSILKGQDNAATKYLKDKTSMELHDKFKPVVMNSLQKVQITKYWNPLITKYNQIPGIQKQNPNLEEYVTQKALEGLFKLIADEELKIRKDPVARVSDILKKVFGNVTAN